jgi:hypothetical protein
MISPPFSDLSPQFWKLLHPFAPPFVSLIQTLIAVSPANDLWETLRTDLSAQPEQWLVRVNWWAAWQGKAGFAGSDWDALQQQVRVRGWSWSSVVPALIFLALVPQSEVAE